MASRPFARLLRRAFLVAAVYAAAHFLLLIHYQQGPMTFSPPSSSPALAFSEELSVEPPPLSTFSDELYVEPPHKTGGSVGGDGKATPTCATVEKMGEDAAGGVSTEAASLRVRQLIRRHFMLHGAARVRSLPALEFCKQGFVLGKASEEAGFGNEMYKILTAAALSVMLNRSLIIGQTRGLRPFGQYISYTDHSFTLGEIKYLWRKKRCAQTYGRDLNVRVDNFNNPSETNVLCSDWNSWKDPIIRFDGTADTVGVQFFLKNVHPKMRTAASTLFGSPGSLHARPNTFGELMRVLISPSENIQKAVQWALKGSSPDIVLHMRMMSHKQVKARKAAVSCIQRAIQISRLKGTPRVALVSDTPSFVEDIKQDINDFAEVTYFDYKLFGKRGDVEMNGTDKPLRPRSKDWGPAPRWAAFVDFFLASSASIHNSILVDGLSTQAGWGHVWNRYAGPLSCRHQLHQCALTPLLPQAWWDGQWQSPVSSDVTRLLEYGVRLSNTGGEVDDERLVSHCRSRKDHVRRYPLLQQDI